MHRDPQLGTKHSLNISVSAGMFDLFQKIIGLSSFLLKKVILLAHE
jgi:hypothetical protein